MKKTDAITMAIDHLEAANKKLADEIKKLEVQKNTLYSELCSLQFEPGIDRHIVSVCIFIYFYLTKRFYLFFFDLLKMQTCYSGLISERRLIDLRLDIFDLSSKSPIDLKNASPDFGPQDLVLSCVSARKQIYRRLVTRLCPTTYQKCFLTGLKLDKEMNNVLTIYVTNSINMNKLSIVLDDEELKAYERVDIIHTPLNWINILYGFKLECDKIGYWVEKNEIVMSQWFLVGGSINSDQPNSLDVRIKKSVFFDLN